NAVATESRTCRAAAFCGSVPSDDIDHAEEGIRAIACGVRAAHDLDAFDVLQRDRQRAPVGTPGIMRGVDRAAVDQYLHLVGVVGAEAVVGHPLLVATPLGDLHARDQAE